MARRKSNTSQRLAYALLLLFLSLTLIQTIQTGQAQTNNSNNQWAITLQTQKVEQNTNTTTFSPFDQIQLSANVTYRNAPQPDILVTFNVQGPTSSISTANITRIETTNSTGQAQFSFRLPIQHQNGDSVIGTWQATATILTTNGTQQKSLSFTTQWNIEISQIVLQDLHGQNQTDFNPNDILIAQLAIGNKGQPQTANITLNMQDSNGKTINQTQILNDQINATSSDPTQIQADIQIPSGAVSGQAAITVSIYSGTYQNISLPIAESKTASFIIGASNSNPNPTATPSPSPTPNPTPTPNITGNSFGLFSWLLVATGFFTFAILFIFLKRRHVPGVDNQIPPTITTPSIPTPSPAQPVTPQQNIRQEVQPPIVPTSKIAFEKSFRSTMLQQANSTQNTQSPTEPFTYGEANIPDIEANTSNQPKYQEILTNLNQIANSAKRITTIKTLLNSENEQLAKELADLNKIVDEREKALAKYLAIIKREIEKANVVLASRNDLDEPDSESMPNMNIKLELQSTIAQEPTLQTMTNQANKVTNLEKRIEALKTTLKLEKEQLAVDIDELCKIAYEQETQFDIELSEIKQKIENLKTYLVDKEKYESQIPYRQQNQTTENLKANKKPIKTQDLRQRRNTDNLTLD